jgi:hypothetical protein
MSHWTDLRKPSPNGHENLFRCCTLESTNRGQSFEPQRNLMQTATGLDGGGSIAADQAGNVYVVWHSQDQKDEQPVEGEDHRRVWLARSTDDGRTFDRETLVSPPGTGACGCCGMGALVDDICNLYLLYRSARAIVHRDMYLLFSRDKGKTFEATNLHPWQIGACPMSTVSLAQAGERVLLSWETEKQIYFAPVDMRTKVVGNPMPAPGEGTNRKHPAIAGNKLEQVLLAWTEGTGWKKGGSLAWQAFNDAGHPLSTNEVSASVPAWDLATVVPFKNDFLVIS